MNYLDKFSLKNKIAFITGGAGLLGSEITKALSQAKAKVIILDINREKAEELIKELRKEKLNPHFEKFDVTSLEAIDSNIENLHNKYGRIDIWINTAYPRTQDWGEKVENLNLASWQRNVDIHLNSYSWISRKVCLIMKKQKFGSLINFGSIYGVVGNNFNIYEGTKMNPPMAYSAIKGGIINLTRYLSSYFGKYNVRINCLCPGGIFDHQDKKFIKNYEKNTPLKRMGKPEDVASACLFLASDASSYITGTTLMVDGGWTAI